MFSYLTSFTNNQIDGNRLLNIRPYELEELGITLIGHQEILLESLEVLKNIVSLPPWILNRGVIVQFYS